MKTQQPRWERTVLEQIAMQGLLEQRRLRRWKIFFRLAWLSVLLVILYHIFYYHTASALHSTAPFTAVIDLKETIDSDHDTANKLVAGIEAALDNPNTRGVIIHANSPGGSPVQAGIAFDGIRKLKQQYPKIPIYTVVEDMCTSGCYYIACATDKIYVDKASIIGSIGVVSDGFGFVDIMKKLGIERRLQTAGDNKVINDPFSPQNPKHQAVIKTLLDHIHQQFIQAVKIGRGNRLKKDQALFSGQIYLGNKGCQLGLADGMGNIRSIAEDVIKTKQLRNFTVQEPLMDRLAKTWGVQSDTQLFNKLLHTLSIR
ncbi:MAG: S49 family peptidase [Neisseriales bacterium]|nr:MAG: S49 family peptidase [Neisseriales bacterium]